VHLDFEVKDIQACLKRAIAAGASGAKLENIRETRWGKIIELADPFGNGLCIIEFVGRGYDEISE
jgi:predicted enzyme related to lactoylglutathione lyase